jgi:peroxiredoxin
MKSMLRFHTSLIAAAMVISLVAGVAAAGDEEKAKGLAIGDEILMADTGMENIDGKELTIAEAKGKNGTLVMFTCNACPWVKAWEERMVALGNAAVEKEIGVIFINSNDPKKNSEDGFDEMKNRSKKLKMEFPYVVDATSDVARAYSATRTPEAFLFDAEGKLVYHGTIDDNAKKPDEVKAMYLGDALNAVAGGESVEVTETKALGCSIKFRSASADESQDKDKDKDKS